MRVVLATFCQRLELRLPIGFEVVAGLQCFGSMRALSGIPMTVQRRRMS
jgi:hypothetical protein